MKNPLKLAGIEPAPFRFVAQYLNHCANAVPKSNGSVKQKRDLRNKQKCRVTLSVRPRWHSG